MSKIQILDCTLRDGGYVIDFNFGKKEIIDITEKLTKASINIIECGFLRSGEYNNNKSLFPNIEAVRAVLGAKNSKTMYVAMIQYGKISNNEISVYDGTSIDGIRLTFHEHEIDDAFILGKQLKDKGYKVFMQPVGTITYTDEMLLDLIGKVNDLEPFAFYMVDTFGTMYKKDLLRMFFLIDHNLNKKISIGFHSHNNLQLAFSNAQELMQMNTTRNIIIDSSVLGMGRGAGNLCTELLAQYINENIELRYDCLEILEIMDKYIKPITGKYSWGYDAAYYIAAINRCHPNYAIFLLNKQTLHIQSIHAILNQMNDSEKILFNKKYIEEQYLKYMNHHIDDTEAVLNIKEKICNKPILMLAPGKSINMCQKNIIELINSGKYYVISINFMPQNIKVNTIFISNMKRFADFNTIHNELQNSVHIILTSNISTERKPGIDIVDYSSYLNEEQCIIDNSGLMCINLLKKVGINHILLAGFDGFDTITKDNYYQPSMYMDVRDERLISMNEAFAKKIIQLRNQMEIEFLTSSAYEEEAHIEEI